MDMGDGTAFFVGQRSNRCEARVGLCSVSQEIYLHTSIVRSQSHSSATAAGAELLLSWRLAAVRRLVERDGVSALGLSARALSTRRRTEPRPGQKPPPPVLPAPLRPDWPSFTGDIAEGADTLLLSPPLSLSVRILQKT